jgi:hypothetical protein
MSKLRQRNKIYSLSHKCFAQTRPARPTLDSNAFRNGEKATVKGWGLAHAGPGHAPSQPGNLVNSGGCPNSLYFVSARMTGTARYSACLIYVLVPLPPKFIAKVHRTLPMTVRRACLPLVV